MKKLVIAVLIGAALFATAQGTEKLWVSIQYRYLGDRVLFIEDKETGTRCYAIANNETNMSGYAIACVPKTRP